MDVVHELPEITRRIVKTSDPDKVILFGSHARGDASPDSDLDLLVIAPGYCLHLRYHCLHRQC